MDTAANDWVLNSATTRNSLSERYLYRSTKLEALATARLLLMFLQQQNRLGAVGWVNVGITPLVHKSPSRPPLPLLHKNVNNLPVREAPWALQKLQSPEAVQPELKHFALTRRR